MQLKLTVEGDRYVKLSFLKLEVAHFVVPLKFRLNSKLTLKLTFVSKLTQKRGWTNFFLVTVDLSSDVKIRHGRGGYHDIDPTVDTDTAVGFDIDIEGGINVDNKKHRRRR